MAGDLVSIVIANYNYGRFLRESIGSALGQTHRPVEVIFIDDGSGDDSLAVAQEFDITVLAQQNQGVSAARNNAAAFARGKYILFLDSDDILEPDAIASLLALIEAGGDDVGYAYGQLQYFGVKDWVFESSPFDPAKLARANYIQTSALIRRDLFVQVGGFDRGISLREDWELFIRLWHAGYRGAFLPRPHLRYRKHKEPTRRKSKRPKKVSTAQLCFLYPRFFWREWLAHPLRNAWYILRCRMAATLRLHGPSAIPPRVVRRPAA